MIQYNQNIFFHGVRAHIMEYDGYSQEFCGTIGFVCSEERIVKKGTQHQSYSGWWYTYPSEKYESQLGLLFPIYGKS